MTTTERLNAFAKIAVPICREEKYPPELLLAQWAAESSWGAKPSGRNNVFGMTRAGRHVNFSWIVTREELTAVGIANLSDEERETITSKQLLPNGRFDVRLRRQFAAFNSVEEAVRDQITLIKTGAPYRRAWATYQATKKLDDLTLGVAKVYATDSRYGQLLLAISKQKNVNDAVRANG